MCCSAIVLGFNIPGIDKLTITRQQIVDIYTGSLTWWNDTTFLEHNPNIRLPEERIIPVVRRDKSGTTEIFTSALSSFSEEWKEVSGSFSEGVDEVKHL